MVGKRTSDNEVLMVPISGYLRSRTTHTLVIEIEVLTDSAKVYIGHTIFIVRSISTTAGPRAPVHISRTDIFFRNYPGRYSRDATYRNRAVSIGRDGNPHLPLLRGFFRNWHGPWSHRKPWSTFLKALDQSALSRLAYIVVVEKLLQFSNVAIRYFIDYLVLYRVDFARTYAGLGSRNNWGKC